VIFFFSFFVLSFFSVYVFICVCAYLCLCTYACVDLCLFCCSIVNFYFFIFSFFKGGSIEIIFVSIFSKFTLSFLSKFAFLSYVYVYVFGIAL
jgi:hypothetical protein